MIAVKHMNFADDIDDIGLQMAIREDLTVLQVLRSQIAVRLIRSPRFYLLFFNLNSQRVMFLHLFN